MSTLLSWYLVACLSVIIWNVLHSQTLYDNDCDQYEIYNQDRKITALRTALDETENLIEETTTRLKYVLRSSKNDPVNNAYNDLLRMYGSQITPTDNTIDEMCKRHPNLIIGKTTQCQQYYNCTGEVEDLSSYAGAYWPSKYLHECHYPFLFSKDTLQCENYTEVDCGTRYKPIWECRYLRFHLEYSMGACERTYPNCEKKKDGFWRDDASQYRWNYYKICQNGRTIATGQCPYNDIWGISSYPYNGECVHLFAIPKEFLASAYLPSCKGTPDGNYRYPIGLCDAYYSCEGGNATAVKCPTDTVFDMVNRTCEVRGRCQ
ncbi:uncharacterized protein LOC125653582 [Ostrea edulis]|uniref:uncharacterized protein LOC125653582 n=1 Tax=Ostrea edulis TaxID=37623 RepID=UPI0024AF7D26|nr:uncharacterized protein LOC125653582 [Ostrea edulis]